MLAPWLCGAKDRSTMGNIYALCCVALVNLGLLSGLRAESSAPNYRKFIQAVARDIETLRHQYSQLIEFSVTKSTEPDRLVIEYSYRTHAAVHHGGWTSHVPNPDDNGIWFYIDLHEPDSIAQIDTQPAQVPIQNCVGKKRVTFLILEGRSTKPIAGRIAKILTRHGAGPCLNSPK
jgi:hypothetical protein